MIFETKADVDNILELRRRKQALSAQIKAQRAELNETVQEIKADLTPARLVQNTLNAFKQPQDSGLLPAIFANPTGLRLATDFAISALLGSSRRVRILKAVIPAAIQVLPGVVKLAKNFWRSRKADRAAARKQKEEQRREWENENAPQGLTWEEKEWEATEYGTAHRNGV